MNLEKQDATDDAAFAASQPGDESEPAETDVKLDQLDEKLKVILEQARQGEAAAIAKLRLLEEVLLDEAL